MNSTTDRLLPVAVRPVGPARSASLQLNDTTDREASDLRAKATAFEAGFLAEMLGHAGLEPMQGSFGGGIGEEQFFSFLREAQAQAVLSAGGLGLGESIFRALSHEAASEGTSHA